MSRLEELLQTLCPDGVENKTVGELCVVYTGGEAPEDFLRAKVPVGDYIYPIFSNGINENSIYGYSKEYRIGEDAVTFSSIGTIGFPTIRKGKFTPIIRLKVIIPKKDSGLTLSYLKYALETASFAKNKSSVPNINADMIKNIVVPLPPLPVQEEIVRILDTFSGVVTELEAEQAARARQYEHYRNELLSFSNAQFQLQTVGEVCETITDYVAAGSFADLRNKVTYKSQPDFAQLVRTTDLKNNFRNNGFVYVAESAFKYLWRVNLNEESIILPNIGNCGEVYYVLPENLPNKHNVLGPNAILVRSRKVNNKFLSYLFLTHEFQTQLMKITSPTGQTKFNKTDLKRLVLPIPSREVQEQIVSILDRFDALVNYLKSGLPAEIALRRKQYEYYRDKLLTFHPLS